MGNCLPSRSILFWEGNATSNVPGNTSFFKTDFSLFSGSSNFRGESLFVGFSSVVRGCVLNDTGSETMRLTGREWSQRVGFLVSMLVISPRMVCRPSRWFKCIDGRERLSPFWSRVLARQGRSSDGEQTLVRSGFSDWEIPNVFGILKEGGAFGRVGSSVINGCFRTWEASIRWARFCFKRWVKWSIYNCGMSYGF